MGRSNKSKSVASGARMDGPQRNDEMKLSHTIFGGSVSRVD
jgi:hypothetical protein